MYKFLINSFLKKFIIISILFTMGMSVCQRIAIVNCEYEFINISPTFYTTELSLDVQIEIKNVNEVNVFMDSLDMDFYINSKKIADGTPIFTDTIPAGSADTLSIKMNIDYLILGESIIDAIKEETAEYKLEGTIYFDTEYGSYSFPVTITEGSL